MFKKKKSTTADQDITLNDLNDLNDQLSQQIFQQSFSSHTAASIQQILQQLSGLSKEETDELDKLNTEHQASLKKAKLDVFKKLPPEQRQFVINSITWTQNLNDIDSAVVEESPRFKELKDKRDRSGYFGSQQWQHPTSYAGTPYGYIPYSIPLPKDISIDDLKQAHIEATIEEEMLNG